MLYLVSCTISIPFVFSTFVPLITFHFLPPPSHSNLRFLHLTNPNSHCLRPVSPLIYLSRGFLSLFSTCPPAFLLTPSNPHAQGLATPTAIKSVLEEVQRRSYARLHVVMLPVTEVVSVAVALPQEERP